LSWKGLTPSTEIKIQVGKGGYTDHPQFYGYIPAPTDYANTVLIQGKNRKFVHDTRVARHGVKEVILGPASDDWPDADDDAESSEQDDMYKASLYLERHGSIDLFSDATDSDVSITGYDLIGRANEQHIWLDDLHNYDNMEAFAALYMATMELEGSPLKFGGGGSDPVVLVGNTKKNAWMKVGDFYKDILEKLVDNSDPQDPLPYYFCQSNHGEPTIVFRKYPSLKNLPEVIKTIEEDEILPVRRGETSR